MAIVRKKFDNFRETLAICCNCGIRNCCHAAIIELYMNFRVTWTFSRNAEKEERNVWPGIEVLVACTCQIATHNMRQGPWNVIDRPQCTIDDKVLRVSVTISITRCTLFVSDDALPVRSVSLRTIDRIRNFPQRRGNNIFLVSLYICSLWFCFGFV